MTNIDTVHKGRELQGSVEIIDVDILGHEFKAEVRFWYSPEQPAGAEDPGEAEHFDVISLYVLAGDDYQGFDLSKMVHVFEEAIIEALKENRRRG